MSSYYVFDVQETAIDALAVDDVLLVHDTSAGTKKKATFAQSLTRVVATASTGTNLTNNGISVITSSIAAAYTIADPVAGCEATVFATVGSSTAASRTIVSASTSVTFQSTIGSKTALSFPVASGVGAILKGISATAYVIAHPVGILTSS